MFQKLLQHALLVLFTGFALLGSPGLHLLLDISHDHTHHAVPHASAQKSPHVAHSHQCKHHHHSAGKESEQRDDHKHHHPEHECPICEWAAQPMVDVSTPPTLLTFERTFDRVHSVDELAPWIALVTPPARGPPVA